MMNAPFHLLVECGQIRIFIRIYMVGNRYREIMLTVIQALKKRWVYFLRGMYADELVHGETW